MTITRSKYFLLTIACFSTISLSVSQNDPFNTIIDSIDNSLDHHGEVLSWLNPFSTGDSVSFDSLLTSKKTVSTWASEADYLRQDYGVYSALGYTRNFNDQDNVDGYFFRDRGTIGVGWNIINNGYVQNRHQADLVEINGRLKDYEESNLYTTKGDSKHNVVELFNRNKSIILEERIRLLQELENIQRKGYEMKYVSWSSLVNTIGNKAIVKNSIRNNEEYGLTEQEEWTNLPLLLLDYKKLENELGFIGIMNDSLAKEKKKALDIQYKYSDNIGLNTYARYSIYSDQNDDQRAFSSLGVSLRVPLNWRRKTTEQLKKAKLLAYENRNDNLLKHDEVVLANYCYEYEYTFNQYLRFFKVYLQIQEKIRIEKVKNELNDDAFSPLGLLLLYDELYANLHELEDLKKQLYLSLVDINSLFPNEDISGFTSEADLRPAFDKTSIDQSIYIWSSDFGKYSNGFLKEFVLNYAISEAIISVNNVDSLRTKLEAFSKNPEVQVHGMIGSNKYLTNSTSFINDLKKLDSISGLSAIHLDVEPHVLPGWKTGQKAALQESYITLLRIADSISDKPINVSVSMYYDEAFLRKIEPFVEKVYLMAYENPNFSSLSQRFDEEELVFGDRKIISLRTDDFDSVSSLKEMMQQMKDAKLTNRIAIHDLRRYLELIEKEITPNH